MGGDGMGFEVFRMDGGPQHFPDWSRLGFEFVEHMRNVLEPWDDVADAQQPTNRVVEVWQGRAVALLPKKGGARVEGTIIEMTQFNVGPFAGETRWAMLVEFASAADTKRVGGVAREQKDKRASFELNRCDVRHGGTCIGTGPRSSLISFQWLGPKPRLEKLKPLEGAAAPPRISTVHSARSCEQVGDQLEGEERYEEAADWYERAIRLSQASRNGKYSTREHSISLSNLGLAQKRAGRLMEALRSYEKACTVHESTDDFINNIECLVKEMREWSATAGEYDSVIERVERETAERRREERQVVQAAQKEEARCAEEAARKEAAKQVKETKQAKAAKAGRAPTKEAQKKVAREANAAEKAAEKAEVAEAFRAEAEWQERKERQLQARQERKRAAAEAADGAADGAAQKKRR